MTNDAPYTPQQGNEKIPAKKHYPHWRPVAMNPQSYGEYVVYTTHGDVFIIEYNQKGWSTPSRFNKGEAVVYWCEAPC